MIINIVPLPSSDDLPKVPFLLTGVTTRFIKEHRVIPLELKDNVLSFLTDNAGDVFILDALQVAVPADIVIFETEDGKLVDDYLSRFYSQEPQNVNAIIEGIDEDGLDSFRQEDEDVGRLKDLASEAPIIKLVNLIMTSAVGSRASDIHLEP